MKTITFYAYKGGTGRSLVVANVAKYLARFGQKVFVVDFDLEAPGLHYKLSASEEPLEVKQGVVDFFHQYEETGGLPTSLADYLLPVPLGAGVPGSVHLMPAGTVPAPGYWRKLAGLNWHDLFYRPGAKGVAMFLELKERIRAEVRPDFLLIDARTGITEVGGIATTVLPDTVVCLLVNNRENLDGVRVVLRSIQRSARPKDGAPVEIIPVLTRIPNEDDPKEEDALCASIKTFLTAPAEDLEDTLQVSDIFVLHSDPKLQMRERVLVGSEESTNASILLQDYLRLFARLIPREVLRPHTGKLVDAAKAAFFDDPDAAQKEMEDLASYFGHPDIYRELLRLYRARNITGKSVLGTANALWEATHDTSDPILWSAIQANVGTIYYWESSPLPVRTIEAVWSAQGASDRKVGHKIAELYSGKDRLDEASAVVLKLLANGDVSDETLARSIDVLRKAKRWEEAIRLLKDYGESKGVGDKVLERWAQLLVDRPQLSSHVPLSEAALARLSKTSPLTAFRLYRALNDNEKATLLLDDALQEAVKEGPSSIAAEMAAVYDELGRFSEFENAVKAQYPKEHVDDFLSHVRRDMRRKFR